MTPVISLSTIRSRRRAQVSGHRVLDIKMERQFPFVNCHTFWLQLTLFCLAHFALLCFIPAGLSKTMLPAKAVH